MSHIVIHDDSNDLTHYAEFDDVRDAVVYLEDLVNQSSDTNARLFALEPVEFAVKSYVRVEIPGTESARTESADDAPVVEAPALLVTAADVEDSRGGTVAESGPVVESGAAVESDAETDVDESEVFTDAPSDDTVEYLEASSGPPGAHERERITDADHESDAPAGESRRGLFGR